MRTRPLAALLILSALAPSAGAAPIYKVIGADGRISYTDQPLSRAAANVHEFKGGTARAPTGLDVPMPGGDRDHLATMRDNALLLPAVRIVIGNTTLLQESMQLCTQALPASTDRYARALDGWKIRNRRALERAEDVLASTTSPTARTQLKQATLDQTRQVLRPLREGNSTLRADWCNLTATEIETGKADLAANAGVVQLLRARVN